MFKVGTNNLCYCVLIYLLPGPKGTFISNFTDFLSSTIKLGKGLIIGDFNIHLDNTSCDLAVNFFSSITNSFGRTQHVSGSMYNKGCIMDVVFSLGRDVFNLHTEDILVSDHYCIFFNLNLFPDLPPLKTKSQRRIMNQDTVERFFSFIWPMFSRGEW